MARPSDLPTDPRLFPTERNETAELDAAALDDIQTTLREWISAPSFDSVDALRIIRSAVERTGRTI